MNEIVLGTCGRFGEIVTTDAQAECIRRLTKVNAALIERAERVTESQANAYTLFQAATVLEGQVQKRTEELLAAKLRLEKSNREILDAKEAAEVANRSKSKFLTAAGHDLLQPLNAGRLLVSALAETGLSASGMQLVDQVDRALATIEDLIKSVLDISKLDAGVMVPDFGVVPVRELLAGVAADFAPIAAQKGLRLSITAPDLAVRSDPVLLKRIVSNLASNAVRYTNSGGVLLGARRRGSDLRIDVVDTGVGIPPDHFETIFEEFQRGPAQGKDVSFGSGLGLGLAIVRRMAEALSHSLTFRSFEGRGSVFSLTVPIAEAAGLRPDSDRFGSSQAYGLSEARLLLVENDQPVVDAMTALMARWHCAMRFASDIRSSVALLAEERFFPNIIVADYHLDNGLCGLDVIDAIRSMAGRSIPAVIVTADYSPAVEVKVQAKGLALLKKPLKPAELRALITHLLSPANIAPEGFSAAES